MENLDPPLPPPPNQGWENGAFLPSSGARLHPWFEGDGGLLFHFIFSKIVACSRIWDWVDAESRKRERENKTEGNVSPHGQLFACLSLSRFPTILEPGTGHELPRKRITLPLKFGGKFNWGTVLLICSENWAALKSSPSRLLTLVRKDSFIFITSTQAQRSELTQASRNLQINIKFLEIWI